MKEFCRFYMKTRRYTDLASKQCKLYRFNEWASYQNFLARTSNFVSKTQRPPGRVICFFIHWQLYHKERHSKPRRQSSSTYIQMLHDICYAHSKYPPLAFLTTQVCAEFEAQLLADMAYSSRLAFLDSMLQIEKSNGFNSGEDRGQ